MLLINSYVLFIIQDYKTIAFFSIRLRNSQFDYTATGMELLAMVEFFNQFRVIIFGYEINVSSSNKNWFMPEP